MYECDTTHFNPLNKNYNIQTEICSLHFENNAYTFNSSTHIQNNIDQQKFNIDLKISSLHFKWSAYTSTQNNIVQQKYNIHKTRQMLSINIERVGTNNRLIMTRESFNLQLYHL